MDPLKAMGKENALGKDLQHKVVLRSLHSGIQPALKLYT